MKKILASLALAATVAIPAAPAAASETGLPAGTRSCPPLHYGFIVWVTNPKTGEPQDVFVYCQPYGPPPTRAI